MQDRVNRKFNRFRGWCLVLPALALPVLGGCSAKGDLGREAPPSLVLRGYGQAESGVRRLIGRDEIPVLALTAAEDALRAGATDLAAPRFAGALFESPRGDGFAEVEALIFDLRVERDRFMEFVRAARKVIEIDEARERRLQGLEAFEQRRQYANVRERQLENVELIRNGLRDMRRQLKHQSSRMKRLSVSYPDVPLAEAEAAYTLCKEDVVSFHAEIDHRAYLQLGAGGASYKQ